MAPNKAETCTSMQTKSVTYIQRPKSFANSLSMFTLYLIGVLFTHTRLQERGFQRDLRNGAISKRFLNVTQAKFRRICMESSKHNWANISETICPTMLIFGKQHEVGVLDAVLSECFDKSHNFTNLNFMTSPLQNSMRIAFCFGKESYPVQCQHG